MNGKKFITIIFSVILVFFPLITALSPKAEFSESENRELAKFPSFSVSEVFDKSFMNGFDKYISDHFFGRNFWVKAKSSLELITLKKENNKILLTVKNTLVEDLSAPDSRKVALNADGIKKFAENNPDAKIFMAFAPTACAIYSDSLPYNKSAWDQKKFIDSFYLDVDKSAYGIDIYSALALKKDQYIYYGTDHHWTTLGAYYAYAQIAPVLGFKPYDKSLFDVEHASYDFQGTLSSKSNISIDSDTIDIYKLASSDIQVTDVSVNNGNETSSYNSLYFRSWLNKKDKYSVFLGQVQPEITIKTNVQNSKKLLIFKDSYAHSLVPFLALHYSEIKMVDLRYMGRSYRDTINIADYDSVLLLYNTDSVAHSSAISALGE